MTSTTELHAFTFQQNLRFSCGSVMNSEGKRPSIKIKIFVRESFWAHCVSVSDTRGASGQKPDKAVFLMQKTEKIGRDPLLLISEIYLKQCCVLHLFALGVTPCKGKSTMHLHLIDKLLTSQRPMLTPGAL